MNAFGISVVIPTARTDPGTYDNLSSIARSLDALDRPKELVIAVDRKIGDADFLRILAAEFSFVSLLQGEIRKGSARTRLEALRAARYEVILFTDDDCVVPVNWAERMYEEVMRFGAVAGNLKSLQPENAYAAVDAYVDQLRIRSTDEDGNAKYISFPNFGILRQHLPSEPFFASRLNTTEDIELACQLHLAEVPIRFDENIMVETEYPPTFKGLIRRKMKHAMGIAFLRMRLGPEHSRRVGLAETSVVMLYRWVRLSFQASLPVSQRLCMLVANIAYCATLAYYDIAFRFNRPRR